MKQFLKDVEPFYVRRNIVYVDVGAYKGDTFKDVLDSNIGLLEAHLYEPNPQSIPLIEKVVQRYENKRNLTRVALHHTAVGSSDKPIRLLSAGGMTKAVGHSTPSDQYGVDKTFVAPCTTLDLSAQSFLERHISILKIDVEGHELEVLEGAAVLLDQEKVDFIYCEAGFNPDTTQQTYYRKIEDLLTKYKYRVFKIYEQTNEWSTDSAQLRRVNMAFISRRFSDTNPLNLSKDLFESQQKIGELEKALSESRLKETEVENQLKSAKSKLKELDSLREKITSLRASLTRRKEQAEKEAARAGSLHKELLYATKQCGKLEARLSALRTESASSKKKSDLNHSKTIANLKAELTAREKIIAAMYESTSWRITAPIRAAKPAFVAVKRRLTRGAAIRAIANSTLFDSAWYLTRYPDVKAVGVDPAQHYFIQGAAEGRDPGPNFSTKGYLSRNPDVAATGVNPLLHFIQYGEREGRSAAPQNKKAKGKRASTRSEAWHRVRSLRQRLLELGFEDRAARELEGCARDATDPHRSRYAAWELANWYLNKETENGARKALEYIRIAQAEEHNPENLRRAAVMSAEAHQRLGDSSAARKLLLGQLEEKAQVDLLLGIANLEPDAIAKLGLINKAFRLKGLHEIRLSPDVDKPLFDRLVGTKGYVKDQTALPLISVIMPAYNASRFIGTAIESILTQSWQNFELLVVDDHSTDSTMEIVSEYMLRDSRVRLLQTPANSGPYVARNVALAEAAGEFVTCHDADDWSHPQKLELQARHLIRSPATIANLAHQARAHDNLTFNRRGNPGFYCFSNLSSLMFRRDPVKRQLGYWDSVRFMADGEFKRRLALTFGDDSIEQLDDGPTSFQRQTENSLTENSLFGYHGYLMGARKEYFDASYQYHESGASLFYDYPQTDRPFVVPQPMRPERAVTDPRTHHYDIIIASDFRLAGGSTLSCAEEIKAQASAGLRTGIVQMARYDIDPGKRRLNKKIRTLINTEKADLLVYGEQVSCDLLIVRYPPVLHEWQRWIPKVEAKEIRVIVNQPPMSDYGPKAVVRYNIPRCAEHLRNLFGRDGIWHPIGPAVREALHMHHSDDLHSIVLSSEDWVNIVDSQDLWDENRPPYSGKPRIGRHARDHEMKWPGNSETLLKVYPDSEAYEVHIMGGANVPRSILGHIPKNWRVTPFDGLPVKDFLAQLDVFVYFTNDAWVESFGRVIIEAMAAGVPVIVPHSYQELFGEAALYATPDDVLQIVDKLMTDRDWYAQRVNLASSYIHQKFGHGMHLTRVRNVIEALNSSATISAGALK